MHAGKKENEKKKMKMKKKEEEEEEKQKRFPLTVYQEKYDRLSSVWP